ncbi:MULTISPECIES: nuclear transport factor 2 family protein [unclassified Crossiella]|uniref:nuclear transport factor 2 family protein n=1 Tax=unclassified Crossiella TaxID=2620835 RepID=UPI001FFF731E|nr:MULTISPECIES: nuclear transport factor 2 family protein [unclassified Crossiella]MCK2244021.1 nuclear transport factor 2 family protein [Crossiella sp. S99.2]MCK2257121.1 nuclear transport factor 2 family protein [Crossiella sp. S99.1]
MRTPRQTFAHALELLLAKDMAAFVKLWAPEGIMEFPFAAPGAPRRIEGRDRVWEYLRDYPEILDIREFPSVRVHETTDPEVLVVELEAAGFVVASGLPYRLGYVAVLTIRDGEIHTYRDYWSPAALAGLLDGAVTLPGSARG